MLSKMAMKKLHFLPLALFILFPTTFVITYIISVTNGHVEPDFPYISDTGTIPPESCVFAEFINIGAFILGITVYVRFRQIKEYHRIFALSPSILKYNTCSIWFGYISCFGITLVANFQETNVIWVHLIGAFLSFGIGTVYFWFQAVISYYMHPIAHGMAVAHLRIGLAMICTVSSTIASISGGVARFIYFHGTNPRKWNPEDGGWELHIVSTANEWVTAIAFCCYILSFVREFRLISMEQPHIILSAEAHNFAAVNTIEAARPIVT